ncbi:MAG: hypothetical protein WKG00_00105 [Polyangiaceae bacterium]
MSCAFPSAVRLGNAQSHRSTDEMCMFLGSYWPADTATSLCSSDAAAPFETAFIGADWVGDGDSDCAATLECLQTALQQPDDPMPAATDCVLAARPESAAPASDVVRCFFIGGSPEDCQEPIDACLAESAP